MAVGVWGCQWAYKSTEYSGLDVHTVPYGSLLVSAEGKQTWFIPWALYWLPIVAVKYLHKLRGFKKMQRHYFLLMEVRSPKVKISAGLYSLCFLAFSSFQELPTHSMAPGHITLTSASRATYPSLSPSLIQTLLPPLFSLYEGPCDHIRLSHSGNKVLFCHLR